MLFLPFYTLKLFCPILYLPKRLNFKFLFKNIKKLMCLYSFLQVLLDLHSANLEDDPFWYPLSQHDENSLPLPQSSPRTVSHRPARLFLLHDMLGLYQTCWRSIRYVETSKCFIFFVYFCYSS